MPKHYYKRGADLGMSNTSDHQPSPTYTPEEAKTIQQKRQERKAKKSSPKLMKSKSKQLKKSLKQRKY